MIRNCGTWSEQLEGKHALSYSDLQDGLAQAGGIDRPEIKFWHGHVLRQSNTVRRYRFALPSRRFDHRNFGFASAGGAGSLRLERARMAGTTFIEVEVPQSRCTVDCQTSAKPKHSWAAGLVPVQNHSSSLECHVCVCNVQACLWTSGGSTRISKIASRIWFQHALLRGSWAIAQVPAKSDQPKILGCLVCGDFVDFELDFFASIICWSQGSLGFEFSLAIPVCCASQTDLVLCPLHPGSNAAVCLDVQIASWSGRGCWRWWRHQDSRGRFRCRSLLPDVSRSFCGTRIAWRERHFEARFAGQVSGAGSSLFTADSMLWRCFGGIFIAFWTSNRDTSQL